METDLLSLLIKKWNNKTLGHFYILQGDKKESNSFIESFLKKVLRDGPSVENHPDILFLNKDPDKKTYLWDSGFEELFSFLKFKPLNLFKKIIVLSDAHLLTQDISNKILRTLEDLQDGVFFFLCPNQTSLLPTIESRAITLRIPTSEKELPQKNLYSAGQLNLWLSGHQQNLPPKLIELLSNLTQNFNGLQDFLEELKDDSETQMEVFSLLLAWESDHISDYKHKQKFLEEVKRFQTSLTYNNLYKERFVSLLSSCQVN